MENKIVITKHKKGEDGYKVSSIRLPENLFSELDAIADKAGISRNQLIIELLSKSIKFVVIKE